MNTNISSNGIDFIAEIFSLAVLVYLKQTKGILVEKEYKYRRSWKWFLGSISFSCLIMLILSIIIQAVGIDKFESIVGIMIIINLIPVLFIIMGWLDIYESITGYQLFNNRNKKRI